jgi:hypothetical protein
MGRYGAVWMVNMIDKLRMADRREDFVAKFDESSRAFLAQRCANKRGRFLMIAQYGDRRRKGVVMVPEGANGEGWASISRVFQAVVDSLVSRDKAKQRISVEKRRSGVTYADVTANVGTSNSADQRELVSKERVETEGHDHNAALRARIQTLKKELDDLIEEVEKRSLADPMNNCCAKCGVGLDKPPGEIQTQTVVVNSFGDDNMVERGESYRDGEDSRIEAPRETVSRGEDGLGTIHPIQGSLLDNEQEHEIVVRDSPTLIIEKLQGPTVSATRVVNTYCRRLSKSPKEGDPRNDNALVVWVGGVETGDTYGEVARAEAEEGSYDVPMNVEGMARISGSDVRPQPSSWVLQRILDFSKTVGVSCDGQETRLVQFFEDLEAERGHGMGTPGGKTRRKGDRELKRLECSVNYDLKGGETRRGNMGRDEERFR